MKKKWYFRTLITLLAILVVTQQQTVVPNQEIVLEFVNIEITSPEAQSAITIVKKQLQSIGAKHTRISKKLKDGTLRITYYSDEDVECIKRILSIAQNVELDHGFYDQNEENNQFPLHKNTKDYNLDVHEIQKSTDFGCDFNGKYVVEVKQEQDSDFGANLYSFITAIEANTIDELVKVAQKVNTSIAITIHGTSHNIPEVRAGPIA